MAGYFIYSIQQDLFEAFVANPSDAMIKDLVKCIGDEYDRLDGEDMEEDDVGHDWVGPKPKAMELVRKRLAGDNWYEGLSEQAADIFSWGVMTLMQEPAKRFKWRCDADPVYWDVIEACAASALNKDKNSVGAYCLKHFGGRPYRFVLDKSNKKQLKNWLPYHGLFNHDEVNAMLACVQAAEPVIRKCDAQEQEEYDEILLPLLEKLSKEPRMLLIQTDT